MVHRRVHVGVRAVPELRVPVEGAAELECGRGCAPADRADGIGGVERLDGRLEGLDIAFRDALQLTRRARLPPGGLTDRELLRTRRCLPGIAAAGDGEGEDEGAGTQRGMLHRFVSPWGSPSPPATEKSVRSSSSQRRWMMVMWP